MTEKQIITYQLYSVYNNNLFLNFICRTGFFTKFHFVTFFFFEAKFILCWEGWNPQLLSNAIWPFKGRISQILPCWKCLPNMRWFGRLLKEICTSFVCLLWQNLREIYNVVGNSMLCFLFFHFWGFGEFLKLITAKFGLKNWTW